MSVRAAAFTIALLLGHAPLARAATWGLAPGLVAGVRPSTGGFGALGSLGATYRASPSVVAELRLSGGAFGGGSAGGGDAVSLIEAGARLGRERGAASPFLFLGVAHGHEAKLAEFRHFPVQSALAVCDCVTHRTGLAIGTGLTAALPVRWPLTLSLRATGVGYLPRPGAATWSLLAGGALGWRF